MDPLFFIKRKQHGSSRPRKNPRTLAYAREGQVLWRAQRGDFFTHGQKFVLIGIRTRDHHTSAPLTTYTRLEELWYAAMTRNAGLERVRIVLSLPARRAASATAPTRRIPSPVFQASSPSSRELEANR